MSKHVKIIAIQKEISRNTLPNEHTASRHIR